MKLLIPILKLAAILGWFLVGKVNAFTHIVGGSHGWRVPKVQSYYENWAKPRTFGVGDKLVFPTRPMGNNVVMVSKEDFGPCTQKKVEGVYYEGPLVLTLNRTGEYYFFNGIGKHCEAGQKFHFSVGDKEGTSGALSPFKLFSDNETSSVGPPATQLPQSAKKSSANVVNEISLVGLFVRVFAIYINLKLTDLIQYM